ncbi:uncharacterized protein [Populus alba]|uniref:uncharacterized protein isoform X1 n=1 Tax=Populus alba TaxID=43335 RepID=UPI00158B6F07|nr:uncharacterized protein LOC118042425 isoform X1 [Populus alba]
MKFCSSCGKKVSTTREDDEIESCNICGKVLAFPGLRANPRFINGEVVPRLLSKIPSENISRERLYEKGTLMPSSLLLAIAVIIDVIIQDLSRSSIILLSLVSACVQRSCICRSRQPEKQLQLLPRKLGRRISRIVQRNCKLLQRSVKQL